jgi:hypothetical protein
VIEIERERKVREREKCLVSNGHTQRKSGERENLCDWGLNRKKETAGN